jgi:hypothetical protein
MARRAATEIRPRFGKVIHQAQAESATIAGVTRQPTTGLPMWHADDDARCGGCAWRTRGGLCRVARRFVDPDEPACARLQATLDCQDCGACCREAYDAVDLGPRERVIKRHPGLIVHGDGRNGLRRDGGRCAALGGEGPYACAIYEDRPRTCRDFTRASAHCLDARTRVGL